jgi:hypothetical protein
MNKVDKFVATTFKGMVVLYVLVIAAKNEFRPDVYRMVRVPVEYCLGILFVYIGARWALAKLGFLQDGSIAHNRGALIKTFSVVLALILFIAGGEYLDHNDSITKMAIADLQASTDGKNTLGVPIRTGWLITGGMHFRGDSGAAAFSIPVKGSKAGGDLEVRGVKTAGSWQVVDLYLIADGHKTVIQIPH